LSHGKNCKG